MTADLNIGFTREIISVAEQNNMLRNQLAYCLATSYWETAHTMEPVVEAYWLSEEWRKTNLDYYPWYGRGFVQLTWEDNYKRAQDELDLGTLLTDDPNNALDPIIAAKIMFLGMTDGWFTGKKLGDYITLQRSDFVGARKIINGTDSDAAIAAIAEDYDKSLLDMGYGEDVVDPEPTNDLEGRIAALETWAQSFKTVKV